MVLYGTWLCACQEQFQRIWLYPHDNCRHGFASDHSHWLARPASSRWWYIWFDPRPLEAGEAILTQARRDSFNLLIFFFFRKGIIWLGIAFAAEIPLLVCLAILSSLLFCLYPVYVVGVYYVAFEWYLSLTDLYMRSPTELGSVSNIRSVTQRKFIVFGEGDFRFLTLFYFLVVCKPQPYHSDNRCHAGASRSSRLHLRVF